jgi:multiple sugar transport system substrate-binding protein
MTNTVVERRRFLQMAAAGGAALGAGGLNSLLARPSLAQASIRGQEILHWSFLSPEGKSVREVAMREIEAKFAERTGVTVKFQVFPWHELKTKLIAAVQAGTPPDNSRVDAIAMPMVVKANALTNLDPYIARDIADRDDYLMDFKPAAMFGGSKYGMLIETAARGLMVRKDILAKAGVKTPKTWAEFVEVGKAVTGGGRWGYMFGANKAQLGQTDFVFQSHIHGRGGRILKADGTGGFNDEGAVGTYQFLSDCVHKHKITPQSVISMSHDDVSDAFKAGRLAMYVEVSARYRDIQRAVGAENLEVVPIPSDDAGRASPTVVTGWSYAIPRGAKHAEASWEYIKHYTSPETQEINARMAGALPSRRSVVAMPYFQTPEAAYMKWWLQYIAERGEPNIATPWFTELNEVMVDALHQVLLNASAPVKPVLDAAVTRYNQIART